MDEDRPNKWNKCKNILLNNALTFLLLSGVILGCIIGFILRLSIEPLDDRYISIIGLPGELLIRMLKCSATPLIVSCIIVALGSLDLVVSKRICWQLIVLVFSTKFVTCTFALIMSIIIHPGHGIAETTEKWEERKSVIFDIFLDMFRNIITDNMMRMYLQQYQTILLHPKGNETEPDPMKWIVGSQFIDSMNLLGIIFTAVVVGVSLAILADKGEGLYKIAQNIYDVSINVATWILWTSPLFILFLILSEILRIKDFSAFLTVWGKFLLATHAGFIFILLVEYPIIIFVFTRENPFRFYLHIANALVTAYATASSMATMPVVIECLLKHGLDPRIVQFVVPIAININKDGASNFLVVATIFLAQMQNADLTWGHYFSIIILSVFGSVAAAAVPFSAIVVLVMILNGLGLEQNMIAGVLAVEWINDRGSTICNILGNCCAPKLLGKWNMKYLENVNTNE